VSWDWQSHLTARERAVVEAAAAAKRTWLELSRMRAVIVNRAIQRAKAAARPKRERQDLSVIRLAEWRDPVVRANHSDGLRRAWRDPEKRRRMAAGVRRGRQGGP
jgi:hypothetical protein